MTDTELGKVLWDYGNYFQPIKKADLILGLGSSDIRVVQRAAELYKEGFAPRVLFSGKSGPLSKDVDKSEAAMFAEEALRLGIPPDVILTEDQSTNTGDNILFSRELLKKKNIEVHKVIVVQKPYVLRRMYATFRKQWEEVEVMVTAPPISYEEYANEIINPEKLLNAMVKNVSRIIEYPGRGYQIYQAVPKEVKDAMDELIKRGYNKRIAVE